MPNPLLQNEVVPETSLFRRQAVAEQESKWLGSVLIDLRISTTYLTVGAILSAFALISYLFLGSFTRKANVKGLLVPEQGLARIYSPNPGVVTQIYVKEGGEVKKGTPLIALSSDVQSTALGPSAEEAVMRIKARRDSLNAALQSQSSIFKQKKVELDQRINALDVQFQSISLQISLQNDRVALSNALLAREKLMRAKDLISLTRLQRTEQDYLTEASKSASFQRELSALITERNQVKSDIINFPNLRLNALGDIGRNISSTEQELAEAEVRRQLVVKAPQDGFVTAILAEPGSNAFATTQLMSIVPTGSKLQAQLFSPSNAMGFVKAGQKVVLRYQPFPYQKFGFYTGNVVSVSQSPINPSDLPRQLTGAEINGEPVYRITVNLDQQDVLAYGKSIALQSGMQLDADIEIERRSLIEWVFDPLYTLTGRGS